MNKSNTSEIKFRRKQTFRPIMLTSKSIKPIERSNLQKLRPEDKKEPDEQTHHKRKQNYNYALFSTQITKNQMIKKMTDQYRQQLLKNVFQELGTYASKRKPKHKAVVPSVVQVQFENNYPSSPSSRNQTRYNKFMNSLLPSQPQLDSQKKYFYFTNAKTYDGGSNNKLSNYSVSLKGKNEQRKTGEWSNFMQKYYMNVKQIKPQNKIEIIAQKMSDDQLFQISMKVQQYQNNLLKKMQDRFKLNGSMDEDQFSQKRSQSPDVRRKEKLFQNDVEKIEEDLNNKRQTSKKEYFIFGMSETNKITSEQANKIRFESYKDFIWKINFSNGLYIRLRDQIQSPYKLFVGPGNNGMLIKGIMRRRFWWQLTDKPTQDTNFVWTQIKINQFFKYQTKYSGSNRKDSLIIKRKAFSALGGCSNTLVNKNENLAQIKKSSGCEQLTQERTITESDSHNKIFDGTDLYLWKQHMRINNKYQEKQDIVYSKRIKTLIRKKQMRYADQSRKFKIQNHFESNFYLGNKKALFYSLRKYYRLLDKNPFDYIPLTFHISKGIEDEEYARFLQKYEQFQVKKKNKQSQNIWIVKPGQMTNRGRGITVCSILDDIKVRLKSKEKAKNGQLHTYIVQKYIEKPLLYNRRKFDIRHYMMMTCVNGKFKGYWYEEGYLRTTSYEYSTKNCKDLYTHLTNDAIQKYSSDYGKFQKGNKVSYQEFQKYLNSHYRYKNNKEKSYNQVDKYDFYGYILPKMKGIAADSLRATYQLLSPQRYEHNFQLFGLDFMLDEDMNVYLIEVNTNPCLQTSCPLLSRLISEVVQNLFKICIDPLFPPPYEWPSNKKMQFGENSLEENRFTIIFNESEEQEELKKLFSNSKEEQMGEIDQQDEYYEDEGKEWIEEQK